jgi:hypothetical protein
LLVFDAILKELTKWSRCSRSAPSRRAPRFQAQMRQQRAARQLQRPPVVVLFLRSVCDGPGRVDESDITDAEFHNPVVLDDSGLTSDLKYRVVVIPSINTDVLVRALEAMSIGTEVHRSESANASDTRFAREGLGFDPAWRVLATDRADDISPRFVIQVWGAEKIAA